VAGTIKRLGSLQVDHQLVLGWRLHRRVGWLLSLEDAIDVGDSTTVLINHARPTGDQAAGGDIEAEGIDCG
jgi:hypothetical protein